MMRAERAIFWVILIGLGCGTANGQSEGVTENSILVGQSAALKGPARALGRGMKIGLDAAFAEWNAKGGIHGRKLTLLTINDGYEPSRCQLVSKTLIEKRHVFALIGGVGTPTAKAALPICEECSVPFLFPFTGAGFLREAKHPGVLNLRATYDREMVELARHLIDELGLQKIACFYQNDAYGQVGLAGIQNALAQKGLKLVAEANYPRNTVAIAPALKSIQATAPEAIVMIGAYKPCAIFIKACKKLPEFSETIFCNISFVGTAALLQDLGEASEGVIISQVVPFPWDDSLPAVRNFHTAMRALGAEQEIDFITLEGYLSGRVFCEIMNRISGAPTREAFLKAARSGEAIDLGGLSVSYPAGDNTGLEQVWLTRFTGGRVVPLEARSQLGN